MVNLMAEGRNRGAKLGAEGGVASSDFRPRAPRFPIHASVQYRELNKQDWHEGTTVNISRTGILFQTDCDVLPQTALEMRVSFPAEVTGASAMNVVCWGPVVRKIADIPLSNPTVAASIQRYRFSRG
jgi:hypothetical protein